MIKVIDKKIDKHILKEICDAHFKTMVKFVMDIDLKKWGLGVNCILMLQKIETLYSEIK